MSSLIRGGRRTCQSCTTWPFSSKMSLWNNSLRRLDRRPILMTRPQSLSLSKSRHSRNTTLHCANKHIEDNSMKSSMFAAFAMRIYWDQSSFSCRAASTTFVVIAFMIWSRPKSRRDRLLTLGVRAPHAAKLLVTMTSKISN